MKTDLFDYELPEGLIALHPPERRDSGRLMIVPRGDRPFEHGRVTDLPELLAPGTLLVANDTRVIPARLRGVRVTGGRVEALLMRCLGPRGAGSRWSALAKANRPLKPCDAIELAGLAATVAGRGGQGEVELDFEADEAAVRTRLAGHGEVPLPPYIKRAPVAADTERYQTVYAARDGSVAAPTAGLHFSEDLLAALERRGVERAFVTLHVGPGTFRPITADEMDAHRMDAEELEINEAAAAAIRRAKAEGRPVVAVGTTAVRALEGAFASRGRVATFSGPTDLFIRPGFRFRVVDGLITNFHLPRSTLLVLVSALVGRERMLEAYAQAVREGYRFYSYGDAMLVPPEAR
ncbi:MAG: tRNA preQ1(34) S-adenosylmethionine ribosyltransferase-isomerase QueA [Deltaproteobacteria bacterium]|nr:tRNA preQ1(34) S-adenosylmethionine ribosyltransferase-isomerase QueA [Deltaproteobacteria bacterium]